MSISIEPNLSTGLNISAGHREKNRLMSDESCFTTDTVVQCLVKKFFISYRALKLTSIR